MRRVLLAPLGFAYGAGARMRRLAYQHGFLPRIRLSIPVVSVGSLALGGSGKTPIAALIAAKLNARGAQVGVVHGGYRGRAGRATRRVWATTCPDWAGDEAVLLASKLPWAIVVRGPDKVAAARLAAAEGADVVVVDDGFQHLRLRRDVDLLLLDRAAAAVVPAGVGREGASAVCGADLLWFHGRAGEAPPRRHPADVVSRAVAEAIVGADGLEVSGVSALRGKRVFLLAGIARPQAFRRLVEAAGARVIGERFVRDHCALPESSLRAAADSGADWSLCTEKDLARHGELRGVFALRCSTCIDRGEALLDALLEASGCFA